MGTGDSGAVATVGQRHRCGGLRDRRRRRRPPPERTQAGAHDEPGWLWLERLRIGARPGARSRRSSACSLAGRNWHGMFMVELLRAGDPWWFMELNGRPWGSLALARRLGYEYPAWTAPRASTRTLRCHRRRPVARASVPSPWARAGSPHVRAARPRLIPVSGPGRRATVRALLRSPRRSAWYNLGPGMLGVFIDDTLRTLANQTWRRRRS